MDDNDLKILKGVEAPLPRPAVRDAALRAGLQAFEATKDEKVSAATQGSMNPLRLISNALTHALDWTMKHQAFVGVAVVCAIAVPVAFNVVREQTTPPLQNVTGVLNTFSTSGSAPAKKRENTTGGILDFATPMDGDAKPAGQDVSTALVTDALKQRAARRTAKLATIERLDGINRPKTYRRGKRREEKRVATGIFHDQKPLIIPEQNRDQFADFESNPVKQVSQDPVSTFSIDVDTSSYAFARKLIQQGRLPQRNAVRTEEMVNYFNYNYPRPENAAVPFRATAGVYPTPWNPDTKLIHIGIKGYDIVQEQKPRSNLVFLLDVSGSMNAPDKLPLLKSAFRLLVDKLEPEDTVSIVTYAGRAGTVLEPTKVTDKRKILGALDNLRSGGSTAGGQGIRQAYALAEKNFDKDGVNRVILATDGDFNVGIVDREQLKDYIAHKRKTGVFLSILGFGAGNYNDALMQTLAQNGNGNAAYIDSLREAQKVLVEEAGSTLFPIAKDVKIQIEFNPTVVSEYRLIGYETRALKNEDFNNDKVDAGDIGSGHTVTAIYEITPVGAKRQSVDPLRYQSAKAEERVAPAVAGGNISEYAFLKLRYKLPKEDTSKLVSLPVTKDLEVASIAQASTEIRFAASVAAFAEKLRGSNQLGDFSYEQIADLATSARDDDRFGYRSEFVSLVRLAKALAR